MTVLLSFAADRAARRRSEERRLSTAIGVSLVIHALTLAVLRGGVPAILPGPYGGTGGLSALQVLLVAPKEEPPPEPVQPQISVEEPTEIRAAPSAEAAGSRPSEGSRQPARGSESAGTALPEFSIGVGMIDDPAKVGFEFLARLAARFPDRVSKAPTLIGTPVMTYPQAALESGAQRRVAAIVTVRPDGTIQDPQLVRDDPLFGPAVLDALKSARFSPAEIDGNPVPYWAIVEFVFLIGHPRPAISQAPTRRGLILPRQPSAAK
jgi:hypothetical protein